MAHVTVIPRRFILDSGDLIALQARDIEEKLVRDNVFRLKVPDVEEVYGYLVNKQSFEQAIPSVPKGERYGLRKALNDIWELYVRPYSDGFIDTEIKVGRDYLEHITTVYP